MKKSTCKPVLIRIGDGVIVKDVATGEVKQITLHDRVGVWTLMSVLELKSGGSIAVFEDLQSNDGLIIYMNEEDVILELSKTLEPTYVTDKACYRGHNKKEIIESKHDILREEILAQGRDPTFEEIAACFPPIRRVRYGQEEEGPHTFVGSRNCIDVVPIYYNALNSSWRVNPLVIAPEIKETVKQERLWEGLIGGWLPVVRLLYPVRKGLTWEIVIFGIVDPPTMFIQPTWYRFLKLENGQITEVYYVDSYLPYPLGSKPRPERFYTDLYKLHVSWTRTLEGAMELDLPEDWISNFCRHAMVLEMITRIGNHPRYGVVNKNYGGSEHDGFQDILNSSVACYLEWGLTDIARNYLDYYFTYFVRSDGSIDYRGPEIGQYARMLINLAQYFEYTGDDELLLKYDSKIKAILRILMSRRENAKRRSKEDPAYGMIMGRHEADISFITPTLATFDYEQPYFSNSTETWRGFRDLGRAWFLIGEKNKDPELVVRGNALVYEAAELQKDIYRAINRSVLYDRRMSYLPPIAGSKKYHIDYPYRSRPESFDDNRVWSEMMHSGILSREVIDIILAFGAAHLGMRLGIFGNRKLLVAFQHGEAYSLIQHDMIHEFLLFYYSHALHLHTRGTWTALECVDMDRDRGEHLPYCLPAQVTIPILTKWMLVFEDPLSSVLWLAKATPRSWLEDGKCIKVQNATTRWGLVSYQIMSQLDKGEIKAKITLPKNMASEVVIRLRVPENHHIQSVQINGKRWKVFDPQAETISLPLNISNPLDLKVFYD